MPTIDIGTIYKIGIFEFFKAYSANTKKQLVYKAVCKQLVWLNKMQLIERDKISRDQQ